MNRQEVKDLLIYASCFDNRKVPDAVVIAWHALLGDVDWDEAMAVVKAHQIGPLASEYFAIHHITDALRKEPTATRARIEADVRSGKARGIVPRNWPASEPLDANYARALAEARDRETTARRELTGEEPPEGWARAVGRGLRGA